MNIKIESDIAELNLVENKVDECLAELSISDEVYGKILVATMEAVNNAIVHGNRTDKSKNVDVCFESKEDKFLVTVKDEGVGFEHNKVPDPTSPANIENLRGRGVFLMKKLADDIDFNEEGNEVRMKFKIL